MSRMEKAFLDTRDQLIRELRKAQFRQERDQRFIDAMAERPLSRPETRLVK